MAPQPTIRLRMLVIISMVAIALLLLASAVQASGEPVVTVDYQVQAGDNLWSIAEAQTADNGDVRATVFAIQRMNGLDGSMIFAGQHLELPSG